MEEENEENEEMENNIFLENNEKHQNKQIKINEINHDFVIPISCPIHYNIKFKSFDSYLNHIKETHRVYTCECGNYYTNFNDFKNHIFRTINNINDSIDNNDAPPLFDDSMESNLNNDINIKCTECNLYFNSLGVISQCFL